MYQVSTQETWKLKKTEGVKRGAVRKDSGQEGPFNLDFERKLEPHVGEFRLVKRK